MEAGRTWHVETIRRPGAFEYLSGAEVYQLTSAPVISNNIYGEEPFTSADGKRFVFIRYSIPAAEGIRGGDASLWICDLAKEARPRLAMIEPSINSRVGCAKYTGNIFYQRERRGKRELVRLSLDTLKAETVFSLGEARLLENVNSLVSASADGRYYIAMDVTRRPQKCRLFRLDLVESKWEVIHENIDTINAHLQISPGNNDILIQHNRGAVLGERGCDERGATLYVTDINGGNIRQLPLGKPFTAPITGHQAWIGDTGEVIATIHSADSCMKGAQFTPKDLRDGVFKNGTLFAAAPGAAEARAITRGFVFGHISVSMDGKFYIGDVGWYGDCRPQTGRLLVAGSIRTGRAFILCNTGDSGGTPQYTHPHPYFTADNRWVIFNSDESGIPQIYGAKVPGGLLAMLDG